MANGNSEPINYTKRAVSGISILFLMNMIAAIIAYLIRVKLARDLGPEEFGIFSAVFTFIIFFLFFRDLGLGQALTRYIVEFKVKSQFDKIKTYIFSAISIQGLSSVFFASLFFALAGFLGDNYFKSNIAASMLKIFVLYIFASVVFTNLRSIFIGFQKPALYSTVDVVKNSIILGMIWLFIFLGKGVFAPIYAYILAGPLLLAVYLPFLARLFHFKKYKIVNFGNASKSLIMFGLPIIMTEASYKVIGYVDTLVLTFYHVSYDKIGVYNVVLPTAMMLLYLGTSISGVIFPMATELWAKKDKKRLKFGINALYKYSFLFIIPFIFILFSYSGAFIELFFGMDYISGTLAFQILLIGVIFFIVAGINNNIITALGKPKTVTLIILLAAVINFILNLVLIPFYGINGAAFTTSFSYLFVLFMTVYYIKKYIGVTIDKVMAFKVIISGAVFMLIVNILKSLISLNLFLEVAINFIIASAAYFIVLYILKVYTVKEVKKYLGLLFRR